MGLVAAAGLSVALCLAVPCSLGLERALEQGHLPLGFAAALQGEVGLSFHLDPNRAMAYYVPGPPTLRQESKAEPASPPSSGAAAGAEAESVAGPLIVLYEPYYRRDGALIDVLDLPVDAAEYYFFALLSAYLDLRVLRGEGEYAAVLQRRAQEAMDDLPAEKRLEAYVEAVASFGSHLLSVANEIERKSLQRPPEALCAALSQGRGLFAVWRKSVHEGRFGGSYWEREEETDPSAGHRVYSRHVLDAEDKALFVRHVLDSAWTGDPHQDFGHRYCPRP